MFSPPVFSIIVPVYNCAPYIRKCLDSVKNQTFKSWECICVNDGSTDASGSILDEYARNDSRFSVVHQNNQGVSVARNRGIEKACGEWVNFLDADDTVDPHMLTSISLCINKHPQSQLFITNSIDDVYENGEIIYSVLDGCNNGSTTHIPYEQLGRMFSVVQRYFEATMNKFFLRSSLEECMIRFQPGIVIFEDLSFVVSYISRCKPNITYIHNAWYHYRLNRGETSTSRRLRNNFITDIASLLDIAIPFCESFVYSQRKQKQEVRQYFISKISVALLPMLRASRKYRWKMYREFRKKFSASQCCELYMPGYRRLAVVAILLKCGLYPLADLFRGRC